MEATSDVSKVKSVVPMLMEKDMSTYRLFMEAHLMRYNESHIVLTTAKPVVDEDALTALLSPTGQPTAPSRAYLAKVEADGILWTHRNFSAYSALVESCRNSPSAILIIKKTNSREARIIWDALRDRFESTAVASQQLELVLFNDLHFEPGESINSFVERMIQKQLVLEGLGKVLSEDIDMTERFKAAVMREKSMKELGAVLQVIPNFNWAQVLAMAKKAEVNSKYEGLSQGSPSAGAPNGTDSALYTSGRGANAPPGGERFNSNGGSKGQKQPGGKFQGVCSFCGIKGHTKPNCHRWKAVCAAASSGSTSSQPKPPFIANSNGGGGEKRKLLICFKCHQAGHKARNCPNARVSKVRFAGDYDSTNYTYDTSADVPNVDTTGSAVRHSDARPSQESAFMLNETGIAMDVMDTYQACLDSGSSSHLVRRSAVSADAVWRPYESKIRTAKQGASLRAIAMVDMGCMRDCLVVADEHLHLNLISVPKLDSDGCVVKFSDSAGQVFDSRGILRSSAILTNRLYMCDIRDFSTSDIALVASVSPPETINLWHNRLGHRNLPNLKFAFKQGLLLGPKSMSSSRSPTGLCDSCTRAKITRYRFGSSSSEEAVVSNDEDISDDGDSEMVLDAKPSGDIIRFETDVIPIIARLCTDTKGPLSTPTRNGHVHYQCFIDNSTKFIWVYTMKTKDLVFENLKDLIEIQLAKARVSVHEYHSDGAPELMGKQVVNYLAGKGCKVTYSPAYTPQLNALVERNHRTIFEMAYAMLLGCSIDASFWDHAIHYAAAIYNRLPTKTSRGYMSPYQARFDEVPSVERFKIFGCVAYVFIHKEEREKGFVDKSYRGLYLGIDDATGFYKVYIPGTDTIKVSAHVAFDEVTLSIRQEELSLKILKESKHVDDFKWLEGMCYLDNHLLYVTTRVGVQRTFIVAWRALVGVGGVRQLGPEQQSPIHVADVVLLVKEYQQVSRDTAIVLDGVKTLELQYQGVAHVPASGTVRGSTTTDVVSDSLAGGVPTGAGPHSSLNKLTPQSTNGETRIDPPRVLIPRNRQRTIINVGTLGDVSHCTNLCYEAHEYALFMPDSFFSSTDIVIAGDASTSENVWLQSQLGELFSLVVEHDCWETAPRPVDANPITIKWVHTVKADGKRKSRLVARGFTQQYGVDYTETYAPVAKMSTVRVFLSLVGILQLYTHQLDVKTAFLNAPMTETVWVKPQISDLFEHGDDAENVPGVVHAQSANTPVRQNARRQQRPHDGLDRLMVELIPLVDPRHRHRLQKQLKDLRSGMWLRLKKSLYGTKQAPRNWNIMLNTFLLSIGFKPNPSDTCLYSKVVSETENAFLIIYVDDILVAASTQRIVDDITKQISNKFNVSLSDNVNRFLNMDISVDREAHSVTISQERYIQEIWSKFGLQVKGSVNSPLSEGFRVTIAEEEKGGSESSDTYVATFPYQEMLGSLLFLAVCTRPNIAYAVGYLARFSTKFNRDACRALERVLQFVFNTRSELLVLGGKTARLVGYVDSDFAGDSTQYKSTTGYIIFLGNGPIIWYSKLQSLIAQSTAEAEYVSFLPICKDIIWARSVLAEMDVRVLRACFATTIWCDNKAAIDLSNNPVFHARTKHIGKVYHLVRDLQALGVVKTSFVGTADNLADLLTKPVSVRIIIRFNNFIFGRGTIIYCVDRVRTIQNENYF